MHVCIELEHNRRSYTFSVEKYFKTYKIYEYVSQSNLVHTYWNLSFSKSLKKIKLLLLY